ncbi:MAG: DUF2298 domain-containing protein, partial [Anaerolineae bacterium]|nr:DUF2298 domain-containing protein [Anaerolineae bacterium]
AVLRLTGLDWDEGSLLHPDERFLLFVENDSDLVDNLGEYFDTANSSLNPHNNNHGFFVYGTFPIFLVRYMTEWFNPNDYPPGMIEFKVIGRQLSTLADLLVILVVYFVGSRAYNRRVGLIAAFFSTFTVLQIQLSHFFAVDTYLNLFILLCIYLALIIAAHPLKRIEDDAPPVDSNEGTDEGSPDQPSPLNWVHFALFGLALGVAMATKVSALPVAALLPLAVFIRMDRFPIEERKAFFGQALTYIALAAVISFITFRIFQPYAFSGPSFFNFSLNDAWLADMAELRVQVSGDADIPPGIQWARRPIWFSFQNISLWGIGLPMALTAWTGFAWIAWRILKGGWKKHLLLWTWAAGHLAWRSLVFNPSMRYQLPIYPILAVFAAWTIVRLWDATAGSSDLKLAASKLARPAVIMLSFISLASTVLWAYAFSQTYTQTFSRVAASRWIFENIPGPINLSIETDEGLFNQPIPYAYNLELLPGIPYNQPFTSKRSGTLQQVSIKHMVTPTQVLIFDPANLLDPALTLNRVYSARSEPDHLQELVFKSTNTFLLQVDRQYTVQIDLPPGVELADVRSVEMVYSLISDQIERSLPLHLDVIPTETGFSSFQTTFTLPADGRLGTITIRLDYQLPSQIILLEVFSDASQTTLLASAEEHVPVSLDGGDLNDVYLFELDSPIELTTDQTYYFKLSVEQDSLPVTLLGAALAHEGDWDDPLPTRLEGYDGYGGIYQNHLHFQMYWDDNEVKREIFLNVLENSEYLTISSSRQWGSTTRIPERYPLNIAYYRGLMGCPEERTVEWCYNRAQVGTFEGQLGFDLIQVIENAPTIGSFRINDQPAEEAFTVYDHPKVFIFQKNETYDHSQVEALLNAVDLSSVIRLLPKDAKGSPGSQPNLKLSAEEFEQQQQSSTWSELFDVGNLINSSPVITVLVWYLAVAILGLFTYPLIRLALPGLQDRGYPFSRIAGMLLLSFLSWLIASVGGAFSSLTIGLVYGLLIISGVLVAFKYRRELLDEWRQKRAYFLRVELLFLLFFLVGLFIRWGNPDLWHPSKGGEKPMDFSYFNAVLKSTSFPPYDPWFAGGYINYYYFGFVYVGALVKLLGIVPTVAYNIILPTLFGFLGLGAFSLSWNLFLAYQTRGQEDDQSPLGRVSPWLVGLVGALALAVLGNLGTLQMFAGGLQALGAGGLYTPEAGVLTKLGWMLSGIPQFLGGTPLPIGLADWYWNPSRVIPAGPINEFPMFTILYADLHAHLIALPLTLLSVSWAVSLLVDRAWYSVRASLTALSDWRKSLPSLVLVGWSILFGALLVGALRPTNTWDFPTYLILGAVVLAYTTAKFRPPAGEDENGAQVFIRSALTSIILVAIFALFSMLLYQPYANSYVQGYNTPEPWLNEITPLDSYITHWGVFLFVIISWLAWETRQWMAQTPLSSLRKLIDYQYFILSFVVLVFAAIVAIQIPFPLDPLLLSSGPGWVGAILTHGVDIAWLVILLAVWTGVLILRPGLPDAKRLALFMVGTGLVLTLMVEVLRIEGDIGRMNTVFKFYIQVWALFAVVSAAALGWLLQEIRLWLPSWRAAWQSILVFLFAAAALFPIRAGLSKIQDRMSAEAPRTLDGLAYMENSSWGTYDFNQPELGAVIDLNDDYNAIHWMQDNVSGTPVIVEAQRPPYQWSNRFTIYTGLPGVLGWDHHQRQQREFVPGNSILDRVVDIKDFYETDDPLAARDFLLKYGVKYIIFGHLERLTYSPAGFDKFETLDGTLWRLVFEEGETAVYEIIPGALLE